MLEKCDGPACPRCGCQDTAPHYARNRWGGGSVARRRCRHCACVFVDGPRWDQRLQDAQGTPQPPQEEAPPAEPQRANGAVVYRPVRCPKCGSTDVKITSTRRPVRHHKCRVCEERFKSVEG